MLEAVDCGAVARRLPEVLARGGAAPAEGFIGTAEAARRWGVQADTVLAAIADGRLPASKPGGCKSWRIKPSDLEAFLAGQDAGAKPVLDLAAKRAERARALANAARGRP